MELLGLSLEGLFDICNRHFSLKSTCMIAIRLIDILEFVHSKNIIHRDIKPQNFCIGRHISQQHQIRIVDFGLATEFVDRKTGCHIALSEDSDDIVGTPLFISANAHLGERQSRRDDLESVGFMLVYLMQGSLPWSDLPPAKRGELLNKVFKIKSTTPFITSAPDCQEFMQFLEYSRNLDYFEQPQYDYLRNIWSNSMSKRSFEDDGDFDWTPKLNLIASFSVDESAPNTPIAFPNGSTKISVDFCVSSMELLEPGTSRRLVRQDKHFSGAESADERTIRIQRASPEN